MSNPKTPSSQRTRSDAKTPLTPSIVNRASISSVKRSKSHSKLADTSNPFVSKSRPVSPVKRATPGALAVSDSLSRQASGGVIRKGGVESRLDVVTRDYVPPHKPDLKRSRSTPAVVRSLPQHTQLSTHSLSSAIASLLTNATVSSPTATNKT
ncbi:hypothetical protein PILCRDRAFT_825205 [Piloderma croceum F 1598]|uniref:Uncharacterized protein n=1 Tax=Piloderma croceum (strain F 1598) TaxID=765440 RepID=A0A0C3BJW2_PILCF|nr:hypothetical protein PILCRDRAFT_825205 [Piloderma croceum F 1598]